MGALLGKEAVSVVYNGRLIEEIRSLFSGNVLVPCFVITILLRNIVVTAITDDF